MAPLFAFNILTYRVNPLFVQPGQTFTLLPSPGFSAASYSISGTLPAGISFNTLTGAFSGPAISVTPATTLLVTANLIAGGTSECSVVIEVTDIPVQAVVANQGSSTSLTNNILLQEQNFLACAEQMINNNNKLGIYWAYFDLQDYVSFRWVYFYFTKLNYVVVNQSPSQNDYAYTGYFGNFPQSFPGPLDGPFGPWFDSWPDVTQPYSFVQSHPVRRVKISWSPFVGYCGFPYTPWPGYGYPF